jgi:ribosomal protein S18 acetylase RimI-like enzyme
VEDACRAAAARGVKQATLLVAESNTSARALYDKMGFTNTSQFIAGTLTV